MRIIESNNALLSNYEVYQHLVDQQKANKRARRKVPGNLETLRTEVITYLREKPGPLANQETTHAYGPKSFQTLLEKIREANFELSKGEVLQIVNLRPSSNAALSAIVELLEDRFDEEQQNKLLEIIAEVLGRDEPAEDPDAMETIENGN
ncbi:RNA polymerase II [Naviculisporaceae sp. PSN 640]